MGSNVPHPAEQTPIGHKILNNSTQLKPEKKTSSNFNAIRTLIKQTAGVGVGVRAACLFSDSWKLCVEQLKCKIQPGTGVIKDSVYSKRCAVCRKTRLTKAGGTQPGALPGSKSVAVEWSRHTCKPCSLLPDHLSRGCQFCTAVLTV